MHGPTNVKNCDILGKNKLTLLSEVWLSLHSFLSNPWFVSGFVFLSSIPNITKIAPKVKNYR